MIRIYIYTHTHTHTFFFMYSFPLWLFIGYWMYSYVLYSRALLFIHSMYNTYITYPQLLTPPLPSALTQPPQVCSLCPLVYFCFIDRFMCVIFHMSHVTDTIWYLSFWLTLLSMMLSSCIHFAANGIYFIDLLYLVLCWWTFRLFPSLSYCE